VKTDSEYSPEFAADNLLDDLPTAWASRGTPMPHWAEIMLAEPVDVARIELISREGPYVITDIDIETYDGKTWKPVQSVRGATRRAISVPLAPPVRTSQIRVKILHELYQGADRQYADVEAIRVLDKAGRNCAINEAARVPTVLAATDVKEAFADRVPSFLPMAVRVEPTTAEVVATLDDASRSPAILRNRCGQGEAFLVTTSEASFPDASAFWTGLRKLAVGKPTLTCKGEHADRYRIILTQVGERHVLHVIAPDGGAPKATPTDVTVSLEMERLGAPRKATRVEDNAPVQTLQNGGLITFTIRPDPVSSVLLE